MYGTCIYSVEWQTFIPKNFATLNRLVFYQSGHTGGKKTRKQISEWNDKFQQDLHLHVFGLHKSW